MSTPHKKTLKGRKAMKAKGLSVLIVSGLFGAGKSTLIRKVIADEKKNVKIAVYLHSSTIGKEKLPILFFRTNERIASSSFF